MKKIKTSKTRVFCSSDCFQKFVDDYDGDLEVKRVKYTDMHSKLLSTLGRGVSGGEQQSQFSGQNDVNGRESQF